MHSSEHVDNETIVALYQHCTSVKLGLQVSVTCLLPRKLQGDKVYEDRLSAPQHQGNPNAQGQQRWHHNCYQRFNAERNSELDPQ
jgi:hypothetical protein